MFVYKCRSCTAEFESEVDGGATIKFKHDNCWRDGLYKDSYPTKSRNRLKFPVEVIQDITSGDFGIDTLLSGSLWGLWD